MYTRINIFRINGSYKYFASFQKPTIRFLRLHYERIEYASSDKERQTAFDFYRRFTRWKVS